MQTFLPYPSFQQSAKALDYRRLGKQRVEAWQILNTLTGKSTGWQNHPAVKMWKGFEGALAIYGETMCLEWMERGYNDTMLSRFNAPADFDFPPWIGDENFHSKHRGTLLFKNLEHYKKFGWTEEPKYEYWWPI